MARAVVRADFLVVRGGLEVLAVRAGPVAPAALVDPEVRLVPVGSAVREVLVGRAASRVAAAGVDFRVGRRAFRVDREDRVVFRAGPVAPVVFRVALADRKGDPAGRAVVRGSSAGDRAAWCRAVWTSIRW